MPTMLRLLLCAVALALAGCGGCEGRISNAHGAARCSVFSIPW